ncbi:NPC intracellular cholesterol transporter 1-like [Populus alba x Populus x berolinensis]|nr:NPC intracellular cholesterol transporter 1-like [Populus alba x Populus x berolinensis]
MCFRHSDLVNDRPSTVQFREKLPWFLDALPSSDCAKGGHGAYTSSVDLNGYKNGVIRASEFRTYHTPVNKQGDYVNALRAAREFSSRISDSLKIEIFPYSVFYIFFEQYLDIWRIALINIAIALGAIFIVCLVITSSFWCSAIILLVLVMIVVDLMGVMAILDIQLNAVSVVNLIMSIGIAVEFCVHIAHAFLVSHGDRGQRAKEALSTMGASVFSGITLTKLVGVIVLFFARSEVFVVYYFQMYLALVIIGFLAWTGVPPSGAERVRSATKTCHHGNKMSFNFFTPGLINMHNVIKNIAIHNYGKSSTTLLVFGKSVMQQTIRGKQLKARTLSTASSIYLSLSRSFNFSDWLRRVQ